MLASIRSQLFAIVILLVLLGLLFVFAGTMTSSPGDNRYASNQPTLEEHVGDEITLQGGVTETDPLTIEQVLRAELSSREQIKRGSYRTQWNSVSIMASR